MKEISYQEIGFMPEAWRVITCKMQAIARVMPSFVNSYITETESQYLQLIKAYYTTDEYAEVMAALTELYYTPSQILQLAEWHIYGSSRVGIYKANKQLAIAEDETITTFEYQTRVKVRYNGKKMYELSNHLGNVLVTISDRRTPICNDQDSTLRYEAVVVNANDYYVGGMPMSGRIYSAISIKKYRFSYNGKEKLDEIYGVGNCITYEARIYDSRLDRFLSTDPKERQYAWQSSYAYFKNSPIQILDIKGMGGDEGKVDSKATSSKTQPSPLKQIWWDFRLAVGKNLGLKCINIKKVDYETDKKYSTTYCGKESKSEGDQDGGGSGPVKAGSTTGPATSVTVPGVPPGAVAPPGAVGGAVVLNLTDRVYPGSGFGVIGRSVVVNSTFTIPPALPGGPATGTLSITYGANLAVVGAGAGDGINNNFIITPAAGGLPVLNTGPTLINLAIPIMIPVVPGQTFNVRVIPGIIGVNADLFNILGSVTFP